MVKPLTLNFLYGKIGILWGGCRVFDNRPIRTTMENIKLSDHFTYKKLYRFVLPSVIMMIFTSIYSVVDGFFISNFIGKTEFASINIVWPFFMILGGTGFMIGTGGAAFVTKTIGEGDRDNANRYFSMLIIFTIVFGLILTAIGIVFIRPVSVLLGADENMLGFCIVYGTTLLAFTVFFMLQNVFQSFLAAAEKPKHGLYITILAGVANGVLDALFIVVFKWGLFGAALATGIGQVLGGIIPLFYFARKNDSLLKLVKTKIDFKIILKVCGNGSSELLTNLASSIVSMLYNLQLMRFFGEDGVSAYGVLMYVQLVFLAIEIGFSMGSAPIISFNYGAANKTELKSLFKKSIISMSVAGILLSCLAQLLAVPLAKVFVGAYPDLLDFTVSAFRSFSFAFIFSGITIFSSGFFTALNNGAVSAILSFARSLVFQSIFVLTFSAEIIWWAAFATEVCAFITSTFFFIIMRKRYGY